jgi:hypothetical protein
VVSRFINEPAQLLTQFPSGGQQMISLIRDLVASDPGTLPLILSLNAKANSDQVEAIGTGLGQVALVCSRTAQAFASEILRMTLAADNQPLTQAFAGVMGDLFFDSVGPAGVGGGGGPTATSGAIGGAAVSGANLNLTTSVRTGSINSLTSGAFTSATPGSPGSLFTSVTPASSGSLFTGRQGGSVSQNVITTANTLSKSVSPSRP